MSRPVITFCGKGGVGKTSLSLAFALWQAQRRRRVLVVTSHPLRELALSVSLAGLQEAQPGAAASLFIAYIDAQDVLRDEVKSAIGSQLLADKVTSSRVYNNLIEVVPGLKEIAFVSRMRELSEQGRSPEAPGGFDLLVWDAPATGHFLRTIEVAKNFDAHLSGPLALLGKDLVRFLSDPSLLIPVPVAILEEMVVEETIELCEKLTGLNMRPAAIICNMTSPLLGKLEAEDEDLRREFVAETKGSGTATFILERQAIERALSAKLRLAVDIPAHNLQRKPEWRSDVELLTDLGVRLSHALGENFPEGRRP